MHIHILGICGTFMGGVAALAKAAGHVVTGSDRNVYPPMSTQLEELGIRVLQGYDPVHLEPAPDRVVVGNVLSRGNPAIEFMLDRGLPYTSGPQWLAEHVLRDRWVLVVAGTHGKTTTASMLAWILEHARLEPGFLIGGVPENFGVSARLGKGQLFVVEGDEYDSAYFDKRSKFIHYRPRTLALNNLEYDHADIFPDLTAIQRQFHHLVRTVPGRGLIVVNAGSRALQEVLEMGCWTPVQRFGSTDGHDAEWQADREEGLPGSAFAVRHLGQRAGTVRWRIAGSHNRENALAAIAAACHAGVQPSAATGALGGFLGVKRRLEVRAEIDGLTLYDDFAHHPTAIAHSIAAVRELAGRGRVIAVLEPRSNTMRMGVHTESLAPALRGADRVWMLRPTGLTWDLGRVARELGDGAAICENVDELLEALVASRVSGDHVVLMSNGDFGGLRERLEAALRARA